MGTYGLISGASAYIVAAVRPGPGAMEDLGYVVEGAVLEATAMGFATCWVGGVFSRASAASAIGLRPGELVPAVIALGRPAGKRSLADRIVTGAAKSRTRKPAEALFFPVGGSRIPETWNPVLEAVRIAPSASNKQPWRLVFDGRALLFLDEDKVYNNSLGEAHLQNVDMGIAMRHFADAASSLIPGSWVPPEEGEAYRFGAAKGWTPIASWR